MKKNIISAIVSKYPKGTSISRYRLADLLRLRSATNGVYGSARQAGKIIPQPCEICGSTEKIEGHHDDYRKPLDVVWMCKKHHMEMHGLVMRERSAFGMTCNYHPLCKDNPLDMTRQRVYQIVEAQQGAAKMRADMEQAEALQVGE
jgi:hypothetical protein